MQQFFSNIMSPNYQFFLIYGHTGQTTRVLCRSIRHFRLKCFPFYSCKKERTWQPCSNAVMCSSGKGLLAFSASGRGQTAQSEFAYSPLAAAATVYVPALPWWCAVRYARIERGFSGRAIFHARDLDSVRTGPFLKEEGNMV